ncbi:MAG: cell envelope biogenesis protein OmpA [Syntrophales bacterium]|jgi:hypothetical protein
MFSILRHKSQGGIWEQYLCLLSVFLLTGGCSAHHGPVLYPNAHLKAVGEVQAQKDIAECEQQADAYVKSNRGANIAKSTAVDGAGGAVVGVAVGAITGHLGRGVGVGATAGAAVGLVRGAGRASKPGPIY